MLNLTLINVQNLSGILLDKTITIIRSKYNFQKHMFKRRKNAHCSWCHQHKKRTFCGHSYSSVYLPTKILKSFLLRFRISTSNKLSITKSKLNENSSPTADLSWSHYEWSVYFFRLTDVRSILMPFTFRSVWWTVGTVEKFSNSKFTFKIKFSFQSQINTFGIIGFSHYI